MKEVYSSDVRQIGYKPDAQELFVAWQKEKPGKEVSIYFPVDYQLADQVMNAWSIGKAIRAQIKPVFNHRYAVLEDQNV